MKVMKGKEVDIKKPHRFLFLPKSSLSVFGQDIFAILLLKVAESYDKHWFGQFDLQNDEEIEASKSIIIDSLLNEFTINNNDLMALTSLRKRDLIKSIKVDKRENTLITNDIAFSLDDWSYELEKSSKELHQVMLESYSKIKGKDKWLRVINPLLIQSSYDGENLNLVLHKSVAYELIRLNMNGQGFSEVPKDLYFSLRNIYAKKILELICRFKGVVDYKLPLVKYFQIFDVDFFKMDTKERRIIIEKSLARAITYLVSKSNGVVSIRNSCLKGYELTNLGAKGAITESTLINFRLDFTHIDNLKVEDKRSNKQKAIDSYRLLETYNNDYNSYVNSINKLTDSECRNLFEQQVALSELNLFLNPFMSSIVQASLIKK